jgi:hypothetical protein
MDQLTARVRALEIFLKSVVMPTISELKPDNLTKFREVIEERLHTLETTTPFPGLPETPSKECLEFALALCG